MSGCWEDTNMTLRREVICWLRRQNKEIVCCTCLCTVNSSRMQQEDQTPWLTLGFTTLGRPDPCNGPLVPIGGACHPERPDSKLLSRSAAPHLLQPPGLSSSFTSLRGRRSLVILHQSLSGRCPYLTPVILFWARREQRLLTDTDYLPCTYAAYTHRKPAYTHNIHSLGHIRLRSHALLILHPTLHLEHSYT